MGWNLETTNQIKLSAFSYHSADDFCQWSNIHHDSNNSPAMMWPSYGWRFSQIWFWWGYTSVHLRLSLPIDNCSLRHGEFGWFEPTHLSVLVFFFYFCSFIFFLSLLSQDQTWKRGFQGGSILQQDFQGTRAVQNLFASGEWLWDESARQVNDLSGVPKLERLMLKVPRKRDKWQKWIRVFQYFRFFSEEITRFY